MSKYRIYALIHGETLPRGKIFECEIRKMTFGEQKQRNFSPIQSVFSEGENFNYYKTYVTSLRYVDSVRIKSKYVIICDIEEDKPSDALGGAIKEIDRACRFLSLACLEDIKREFGRDRGNFEPYIYQVNKIYLLDEKDEEYDINFKLESGHIYLPNRPEFTDWRDSDTVQFLKEIYQFRDKTFERALKYLYRSSIGRFLLDSPEKIALDHFKSIEIIVNSLSNKREFKDKLIEAGEKIELTPEEKERIIGLWEDRSKYGDIAHPSKYDQTERYPNQFPLPSGVWYTSGIFDHTAANVILKYFNYKRRLFLVEIDKPFTYTDKLGKQKSTEDSFIDVYTPWGDDVNHLQFHTNEKNKRLLKQKMKKKFAEKYKIPEENILEISLGSGKKSAILRVSST